MGKRKGMFETDMKETYTGELELGEILKNFALRLPSLDLVRV